MTSPDPPPESDRKVPIEPIGIAGPLTSLLEWLGRHRGLLIAFYILLLFTYTTLTYWMSLFAGPESWQILVPGGDSKLSDDWVKDGPYLTQSIIFLLVFFGTQVLFLWGGGRINLKGKSAGFWRKCVSIVIASGLFAVLSIGMISTVLEMFDRMVGTGSIRNTPLTAFFTAKSLWNFTKFEKEYILHLLIGVWIVWLVIGFVALRGLDRKTALSRLVAVLLVGSWIEFVVALPVDIAIRRRAADCPCETGSWIALLFSIPVLLWAIGPGLFLLYLYEVRMERAKPFHALRILSRKTGQDSERMYL